MKNFIKYIIPSALVLASMGLSSCAGDLDVTPIDPNQKNGSTEIADNLLNKCYANMALANQKGPDDDDKDVDGIDGGTSGFIRQLWNANELTTDNFVCSWGDAGIEHFNYDTFDASNPMLRGLYYRCYTGVDFCNQYINEYGGEDAEKTAEARFLRAYYYSVLMDCFGNVPFTTAISATKPSQISRKDLFKWVVNELRSVENTLSVPTTLPKEKENGYGRANKYTDQLLLARLYLNSEVYTGTARNDSALYYAKEVLKSPYKLHTTSLSATWTPYQELFMGNNGQSGASEESLLSLPQDGITTTSYGTSLFMMASEQDANVMYDIVGNDTTFTNNTSEGWAGNRALPDLVKKFFPLGDAPNATVHNMYVSAGDDRALFDGGPGKLKGTEVDKDSKRTLDVEKVGTFTNGFAVCKFNNWYSDGGKAHSAKFPDTDYFLFRLAEAYLIEAEADARLNGGTTTAVGTAAINALRARAHASTKASGSYTLDYICDEWDREFYSELLRRPTLVRFGRFGGNNSYNWTWKGGAKNGKSFAATRNIFAIPTTDIVANGNLKQNPGY